MQRSEPITVDMAKLQAAILHICASTAPDELGKVKLHRILYYADMLHYSETGAPLTGATYVKQEFGPAVKELAAALQTLERDGAIQIRQRKYYGFAKTDFIAASKPRANRLNAAERTLLDDMTAFVCQHTAREISEISHNAAWQLAAMGEEIPYFTVHGWHVNEITDDDRNWGGNAAREFQRINA